VTAYLGAKAQACEAVAQEALAGRVPDLDCLRRLDNTVKAASALLTVLSATFSMKI